MARLLQGELQTRLGVSVIIDNKAGAGGNLGSAEVANADGHTLLLAASGPMAVNSTLFRSVSGGLKPKKSGGGNWRRKLVPEFGGHLWR